MKRWNGWGEDTIEFALNAGMLAFLQRRVGATTARDDATLEQACRNIPASRLPAHRLVDISPEIRLRSALGQSQSDWLKLRYGRIGTVPDGVAFPENSDQVRELLDYAQHCAAAVIPYGGGTSVVGHVSAPPGDQPVLTINLSRLSHLLDLDREAQLATFGAGVSGPDLEAQLRAHGYTLGHFPQSFEYSTLGGWIVTRSSGQQSLRYGRIEQLFAGGKLETPRGTFTIPTFPASAAGTDLREIVLGSEGRIGILTEATVRITPLPEYEAFHAVFFPNWDKAQQAVRTLAQAKLPLSMLRLSNPIETMTSFALADNQKTIRLLQRYLGWRGCHSQTCLLLIGASGQRVNAKNALKEAIAIARQQQGIHLGQAIGEKWKQKRFHNVYLRNSLWQHGYAVDTVETAADWPRITGMMHAIEHTATETMAACGERLHTYTHLSHVYAQGASVYTTFVYRLSGDYQHDLTRWRMLKTAVSKTIVAQGGTISHQHGVGIDHAPYLASEKGVLGMGAMHALFQHFDPHRMMNPGKLLASEPERSPALSVPP